MNTTAVLHNANISIIKNFEVAVLKKNYLFKVFKYTCLFLSNKKGIINLSDKKQDVAFVYFFLVGVPAQENTYNRYPFLFFYS